MGFLLVNVLLENLCLLWYIVYNLKCILNICVVFWIKIKWIVGLLLLFVLKYEVILEFYIYIHFFIVIYI